MQPILSDGERIEFRPLEPNKRVDVLSKLTVFKRSSASPPSDELRDDLIVGLGRKSIRFYQSQPNNMYLGNGIVLENYLK